jgi:predicted TPR repeat methyltransferase
MKFNAARAMDRSTYARENVGGDHLMTANEWLDRAIAASASGQHDGARHFFTSALVLDPELAEAHLGLGISFMAARRFGEAVQPLRRAAASPDAPAYAYVCLGQALYMTGDFAGSADALERASAIEPLNDNARSIHARARTLTALIDGSVDDALSIYSDLAGPDADPADEVLWEAFRALNLFGYQQAALAVGRWRLARNPHDVIQAYMLDAAAGAAIDQAPVDYVQTHFDQFADTFDQHLVDQLGYRVPESLAEMIAARRQQFATILDLGCGTGLAAEFLTRFNGRIVGVDVSQAMLDKAKARGCYDILVHQEGVAFLRANSAAFDLIFAADVLIYFGDLRAVMAAAAAALAPNGLLAITTETGSVDWTLLRSGRFSHADEYVHAAAAPSLRLVGSKSVVLRQEGAKGVLGTLHVFKLA